MQRRNASEDMAIFHFSWTDYAVLNLLDVALKRKLIAKTYHPRQYLNPKFIVPV